MKKRLFCAAIAVSVFAALFTGCSDEDDNSLGALKTYTIKSDYSYTVAGNVITLTPEVDGEVAEYVFSGAFNGQIVNAVKGTKIVLNNFYIKNTKANAAILCLDDTEISAKEGSRNLIQTKGDPEEGFEAESAIQGVDSADIELGGSGKRTDIKGLSKHGVKGDTVKIKGSGLYVISGSEDGSAVNCNEFIVKAGKAFTAVFQHCKNGIKADNYIEIDSGEFVFNDLATGLKTDKKKDDGKENHHIIMSGSVESITVARFWGVEKDANSDVVNIDCNVVEYDSKVINKY